MLPRLIIAIAVIFLLFWLYSKWLKLPAHKRKGAAIKGILIGGGILVLIAVLTGRMHWIGAVFAGALALARLGLHTALRSMPFLRILGSTPLLNNPRFKTDFLDVQVNLKSFDIYGTVIRGPHEGKKIDELSEKELDELEKYYESNHKASFYLIRVIRQKPSQSTQNNDFPQTKTPSLDEAFQVLGLKPGASKKEVIHAHRSLMQKLHPDRGGNDYLASRVNLAKDILIEHFAQNEQE